MSRMKSIFSLTIQSMLELHLELMNPQSLKQNGFWHSEASLLWKSPGFCVQDGARTPSSCLLQLSWLMTTAQVAGDWIFTDDGNRFATLVTDVRKTTSYLTDISTFTAKGYPQIALGLWYGDECNPCHTASQERQAAVNQGTVMTQMYRLFPTDCRISPD